MKPRSNEGDDHFPDHQRKPSAGDQLPPQMRILVQLQPANPAFGLALDEAILAVSQERYTLRLWRNELSVILGRSQHIHDEVDLERCRAENIPVCRRCTGGGTVLHFGGNLNISLIVRNEWNRKTVDDVDSACGRAIAQAVNHLGVQCRHEGSGLFAVDEPRKLSGSAQAVRSAARLYHATLLLSPPPLPMSAVLRALQPGYAPQGLPSQPRDVVSINELLAAQHAVPKALRSGVDAAPGLTVLVLELARSFAALLVPRASPERGFTRDSDRVLDLPRRSGTISAEERSWAQHLVETKYTTSTWTHRH